MLAMYGRAWVQTFSPLPTRAQGFTPITPSSYGSHRSRSRGILDTRSRKNAGRAAFRGLSVLSRKFTRSPVLVVAERCLIHDFH
jgi:hypothetical protein